jgi:hypothetical protein
MFNQFADTYFLERYLLNRHSIPVSFSLCALLCFHTAVQLPTFSVTINGVCDPLDVRLFLYTIVCGTKRAFDFPEIRVELKSW